MEINFMQDKQTQLKTRLRVDHFNKKIMKGKQSNDEIQKDAFLKLLVTQLKSQNPLDPMKDRDFIAQMAQLTSLEKMEKVREGMEKLIENNSNNSLYSLLGKKVTYYNTHGQEAVGAVDAVEFKQNQGYIVVNKTSINPKQILKVE
jgi:flagellar basal-body rod modification protein FlgD